MTCNWVPEKRKQIYIAYIGKEIYKLGKCPQNSGAKITVPRLWSDQSVLFGKKFDSFRCASSRMGRSTKHLPMSALVLSGGAQHPLGPSHFSSQRFCLFWASTKNGYVFGGPSCEKLGWRYLNISKICYFEC